MWRVYLKVDRLSVDALVVSCYSCSLVLNFPPDLAEVVETATRNVIELGPLILPCHAGGCVRYVDLIVLRLVAVAGNVDELQDQRSSGDDAASSWKEISTDNVLENRRLSGRLRTNYYLTNC